MQSFVACCFLQLLAAGVCCSAVACSHAVMLPSAAMLDLQACYWQLCSHADVAHGGLTMAWVSKPRASTSLASHFGLWAFFALLLVWSFGYGSFRFFVFFHIYKSLLVFLAFLSSLLLCLFGIPGSVHWFSWRLSDHSQRVVLECV